MPNSAEPPPRTTFDICILGEERLRGAVEKLTENERQDSLPERTIKVPNIASARNCAILFIGSSEAPRIDHELADLGHAPVLTVSDMPQFLEHGGMVAFEIHTGRVRFAVSLDSVERARLRLSSDLLRVALRVEGSPKGGA